jgi:hypothetical protein
LLHNKTENDEEEQARLHRAAAKCIGTLESDEDLLALRTLAALSVIAFGDGVPASALTSWPYLTEVTGGFAPVPKHSNRCLPLRTSRRCWPSSSFARLQSA